MSPVVFVNLCFMVLSVNVSFLVVISASDIKANTAHAPAFSPSNVNVLHKTGVEETPISRRFLKNQKKVVLVDQSVSAPYSSPTEAETPAMSENMSNSKNVDTNLGSGEEVHLKKEKHRSVDRSVAGGGVILGGLATTFLVAVFCYIRATRKVAVVEQSRTTSPSL